MACEINTQLLNAVATILSKLDLGGVQGAGSTGLTPHSPWDLFSEGTSLQQAVAELPGVDGGVVRRTAAALAAAAADPRFSLFLDAPDPSYSLPSGDFLPCRPQLAPLANVPPFVMCTFCAHYSAK